MLRRTLVLLTLGLVAGGCTSLQPRSPQTAADVSAVEAFLTSYLRAIETRDEGAIRASYIAGDRFAWLEDGKVRYRSADEVLAGLRAIPASSPIRTAFTDLSVVPLGTNAAHARATFSTTIGTPPSAFTFGGAITFALEQEGGSWKIVAGHTSSPSRR
jgi:ketosteroid isomerase-like protein